jgi:PAS domain S-box-containing protein
MSISEPIRGSAAGRKRVLVVDDGAGFAESVAGPLNAAGCDVTVAVGADAARSAIAELLSDISVAGSVPSATSGLVLVVKGPGSRPAAVCLSAHAVPLSAVEAQPGSGSDPIKELLAAVDTVYGQLTLLKERDAAEHAYRETEDLLRAILDNAAAVIYAKDRDGRYLFINKKYETTFGVTSDAIKGRMDRELFPAEAAEVYRRHDLDVVHTGHPIEVEEVAPHADGPHTYISVKFPLYGRDGTIRGVCGISTDITDRKRSAEHLRRAQRMEAVGHLTGGVAHDFNNLNSVILGNLELIEEQLEPGTQLHVMAKRAIEAARRGALLTERLLAFSRKQVLQPQVTDVNALLLATVEFLRRSLGETIEVRTVLAGDAAAAFVDPSQLENAVINLAVNAKDAMPKGGVLMIQSRNRDFDEYDAVRSSDILPGRYVEIAVGDNGTGMTPEVKERVFEPFFTTKEVGKGTGLGLSMVYGFVSQSGGHVLIESEPGRGTTVRLLLPRAPAGAAAPAAEPRPSSEARPGETVFLVEDDVEVRNVAAKFLENLGYRVFQAGDGPSALALLRGAPPIDLLLTDIALPNGMNGRDLAMKVLAMRPETRVLFVSGYADTGLTQEDLAAIGARLLDKPFNKAQLATTVRQVIDSGPCRPVTPPRSKKKKK